MAASSLWLYATNKEKRYAASTAADVNSQPMPRPRASHTPGVILLDAVRPSFLNTCPAQRCPANHARRPAV